MAQNIFFQYLEWHFFDMPKEILRAWKNFLKFNLNYFSIPLLLKTLFSPWRRYKYSYGRGFDLGRYFEVFSFNMMSRTLGAIMRTVLIFTGLLVEVLIIFTGITIFITWLILPWLLVSGLLFGFKIMF